MKVILLQLKLSSRVSSKHYIHLPLATNLVNLKWMIAAFESCRHSFLYLLSCTLCRRNTLQQLGFGISNKQSKVKSLDLQSLVKFVKLNCFQEPSTHKAQDLNTVTVMQKATRSNRILQSFVRFDGSTSKLDMLFICSVPSFVQYLIVKKI